MMDDKWVKCEETYTDPNGQLYLAYQAGHPLKVVEFITGHGMVDVRTGFSCNPTRLLRIDLPNDLK